MTNQAITEAEADAALPVDAYYENLNRLEAEADAPEWESRAALGRAIDARSAE